MTKGEYREMKLLLPLYFSYRQAGVLESSRFKALPYMLAEFDDAISTEERDAKMQALVVFAQQVVEEHESDILDHLSSQQKRLGESNKSRDKLLLKHKIGNINHAIALTTRFRAKYMIPARQSPADGDEGTVNCEDTVAKNVTITRDLEVQRTPTGRKKTKGSSESSQTSLPVQQATTARTHVDDVRDTTRASHFPA